MSTTIGCPIPGASQPKEPARMIDVAPILKNIELDIIMLHGKADELGKSDYAIWCTKEIVKLKDFAEWLKSIPTIDPESLRPTAHWVSVKDRLPDPYEKVLVRLDHWAGVDTYLAFYDTERGWCDYGGYFDDGTNNEGEPHTYETAGVNVTHWMSLPRLPEEEGYYV